jgi:hypothetical protein
MSVRSPLASRAGPSQASGQPAPCPRSLRFGLARRKVVRGAFLDRSSERQPAPPRQPSAGNVERRRAPSLSDGDRRVGAVVRGGSVVLVHLALTRSLVEQRGDFSHPHPTLLMLHLHDRLVRPMKVECENGYLPSELAQGVAGDSPNGATSTANTCVHLGQRASTCWFWFSLIVL